MTSSRRVFTKDSRPSYPINRLAELNLADSTLHGEFDLTDVWSHLMAFAPAHRIANASKPYWVFTRHRDVRDVLRDSGTFSSEQGNVIDNLIAGGDSAGGRMLVLADGRRHQEISSVISHAFGPQCLTSVIQGIERNAEALVATAVQREYCDFATDVVAPIPRAAVCEMMGIPAADGAELTRLTSSALGAPGVPLTAEAAWTAKNEILAYFADLAVHRGPATDRFNLFSLMLTSEFGGAPMPLEEVLFNSYTFLLAGQETTRLAMTGAAVVLADQPDLLVDLAQGSRAPSSLVDELLRWTTPALHVARTATRDVARHGMMIAEGDIVTCWMVAANRDPDVFPWPHLFDPDRPKNPHLSFGHGTHHCLGFQLARIELTAVLTALRDQVASIEVTAPGQRIYSNFLSGYFHLPVRLVSTGGAQATQRTL